MVIKGFVSRVSLGLAHDLIGIARVRSMDEIFV